MLLFELLPSYLPKYFTFIFSCSFCNCALNLQDCEVSIKGYFDAVLDTIGVPDTEKLGVNLLKRGGHYMTLQV